VIGVPAVVAHLADDLADDLDHHEFLDAAGAAFQQIQR